MNINNITALDIEFEYLGFTLLAYESKNLMDIDSFTVLSGHLDELIQPMLDGKATFTEDGDTYTTISAISSYLTTGITKVNITQENNSEPLNVSIDINSLDTYSSDDYYYFKKSLKIVPGQKFVFEFKGYIKEGIVDLRKGNIHINVNDMGGVPLLDYTHFEFNINYKLKNPVFEITCDKISEFDIFIEGIFVDELKSKMQYLKELNSVEAEIDVPIIKDVNELIFKVDLTDTSTLADYVMVDTIKTRIGYVENLSPTYITDYTFKDKMYIDFGEVMNIDIDKDYTISTWIKFNTISDKKQMIFENKSEYSLYVYRNQLKFYGNNGKTLTLTDKDFFEEGKWYNLMLVFTNKTWKILIDGEYITQSEVKKTAKNSPLTISSKKDYLRDVKISTLKMYNYAFSQSMIYYLINTQNPATAENVALDYENGIRVNFYDSTNVSVTPQDSYSFTVLEKKYVNQKYFVDSQDIATIDASLAVLPSSDKFISVMEGYLYFPETGTYTLAVDGDDAVEFILEDESVIGWYGDHAKASNFTHATEKYMVQGYHKFKYRHFENYGSANFGLGWRLPSVKDTVSIVPADKFYRRKLAAQPGLFGMKNCIPYGCSFDTAFDAGKAPQYSDANYDYFECINNKFLRFKDMVGFAHQKTFTFNYWIYTRAGFNYIFAIGNKNYTDYLSGYSSREDINNGYQSSRGKSEDNINLDEWTMVTITGNENTITCYNNGVEVDTFKQGFSSGYTYSPMFVNFGSVSSGTPLAYQSQTRFSISEWFFDDKLYTKHDLLGLYEKTKGIYQ